MLKTTMCTHAEGQALFSVYHLWDKERKKMWQLLLEVTVANTGADSDQKSKQNDGVCPGTECHPAPSASYSGRNAAEKPGSETV